MDSEAMRMQVLGTKTTSKGYKWDSDEQHAASETFKEIHMTFSAQNGTFKNPQYSEAKKPLYLSVQVLGECFVV
jgi:hypothetical protein